ncbi:hypothetical protein FLL45_09295 [Aliikangiella marina]|uniref:Uncharacterized protein n=1 Tax=Aliikangiella marina TaxID=1712262 RepID=A0A545TD22_9GAMM|nr:hypothetical protein [Aliikangiella marina]TQV75122.1 hypothetical protein FLL45_09295 [Aliikangiella marina]
MLSHLKSVKSSRIGVIALDNGWISQSQLARALEYQQQNQARLGETLVNLGYLSDFQLKKALCRQRWMRSFVASVVMLSTPICPVLASEQEEEIDFAAEFSSKLSDIESPQNIDGAPFEELTFDEQDDFIYAISHEFSPRSGIELGLAEQNINFREQGIVPKISIYTSSKSSYHQNRFSQNKRSDRYKNTIPAVYRLTLKGFSIYESDAYVSKYWGFDKDKDSPYKKYEVMFSITKEF